MKKKEYTIELNGKTLTAEFNDLAENAHGSVLLRYGNTVILVTAVIGDKPKDGVDFFPLTVDFEERFYASGKILGSQFVRREGRPSDEAILSGRIIDRTIRPLFSDWIRHDVQVVVTVLSIDQDDPDILAVLGASLALGTSEIPWNGPVSAVRIGKKKNGEFLINPGYVDRVEGETILDMVACGREGNINMIEVGSHELSEQEIVQALTKASEEIEKLQLFQQQIIAEIGKPKRIIAKPEISSETIALFKEKIEPKLLPEIFTGVPGKEKISGIADEWMTLAKTTLPEESKALANRLFEETVNELVHTEAITNKRRQDGRGIDELRPLFAQAGGISPILHGSGIFYRGGTHIFSALTLGGPQDTLTIDGMEISVIKRYMHHYNFPPYSTGETGRIGNTNRRMIGHGNLAEKALLPVLPPKENFPYTIRIVSEALSSNGSTSMGSVCGSTLSLMDAGVPIKAPVAGIASGLMMKSPTEYAVLTDIQGPEDHYGDMDFKVAGTRDGVTAVQMDVKVAGIPITILAEAFEKAKIARFQILDVIEKEIAKPRISISPYAPTILTTKIKIDQIGLVIGPGGKTIKGIQEETGAIMQIEEDGTVYITGKNGSAEAAKKRVDDMTREFTKGERFDGVVTRIMEFGAFVRIAPNTEGLVHISEIGPERVEKVGDYLKEGETVPVIIKEIDEKKRINLSIKQIDPEFANKKKAQQNSTSKT